MGITSEYTFESAIDFELVENGGGYTKGDSDNYDPDTGLFNSVVIDFLKNSQPKRWEKISGIHGADVETRVINRLRKELDNRGSLDVIRYGFIDYGVRFKMAYFKPASGLNPDAEQKYEENLVEIYRQIYFSNKNKKSVDVVLALNGIPVATMELKNQLTGQNVEHAKKQYNTTRDPREHLFAFKKRSLVHFAVDQDVVEMATKLAGDRTYWLPFNKGNNNGSGNPLNSSGYKTSYLWEEVLQKDSWLDIIQRFLHLEVEEIEIDGKVKKKEKLIFPRYHQLDSVRKIVDDVYNVGSGTNYLVQHSAGSGKSNSIAWLAYRLSSLHNARDERIFDSVIVVTDRRVLDSQLQDTIYQFDHTEGVVQKIDKNSSQLAAALGYGTNIIITTLQKFGFVLDKVGDIPDRSYAVIIDEAHSSQGGKSSTKMKKVLMASDLEEAEKEEALDDYTEEDYIREQVEQSAKAKGHHNNISFFAFTATPKYKTLKVFGHKDSEDKPIPFHLYSMRQAIEEGFILDVLKNYTTYKTFFKLTKAIEDDPSLNKKKAAKAIGKYLSLHPHNLAQKTEVIVEHFRNVIAKKIGGKAKAMLVCGSRLHAKRYYDEFQRYIKEKGYQKEMKILVAFSGSVKDEDSPDGISEPQITGFKEKELPEAFNMQEYRILIVANKYQTGFDQPLLHTMYVDKKLSGVMAVQTLSRLNRTCPGKTDTFVLDFVNERDTILNSFQPYYEVTSATDDLEVNHLFDLRNKLDNFRVYWQAEIDNLSKVYFDPKTNTNKEKTQKYLYSFTDPAVERYKELEEEKQDEFKKGIRTWTNLYSFLVQIMPFIDTESEKFYAYAMLLQRRLPKRSIDPPLKLDDEVALEYYRLQKMSEGQIELEKGEEGELSGTSEAGIKRTKEEEALLSEIITLLNEKFATEFEDADQLFFDQIEEELRQDETLKTQAKANTIDNFKYAFDDQFMDKLISRMDQNQGIFEKIIEDQAFGKLVKQFYMKRLYRLFNEVG